MIKFLKFIFIGFVVVGLMSCASGKDKAQEALSNYSLIYEIPLGNKTIKILNAKNGNPRHSDELKMIVQDSKGSILDEKEFGYLDSDGSILSAKTVAIKGKAINDNEPVHFFLVVDESSDLIKQIPCNNFVADGIIIDDYIIYSIEMTLDTTIKVDVKDGKVFEYEGYYPCVDIFECDNPAILGVFKYEGKWYEILDKKIQPAKESYQPQQKRKLNDYLSK